MGIESRKFPRIQSNLKIGYEFVKWNEKNLDKLIKPNFSNIFDISVSGIGLKDLQGLDKHILKQLETGAKKVRLGIYLDDNKPPLITFARLIWSGLGNDGVKISRFGFLFLDVTEFFFKTMNEYVRRNSQ